MIIKKISIAFAVLLVLTTTISCQKRATQKKEGNIASLEKKISLAKAFEHKFYVGTALNEEQILQQDTLAVKTIKENFNAIVAENCMKSEVIQPYEGVFDFKLADKFVSFGEANNMFIGGHTLIWHSQAPKWFFVDKDGNDVSKEILIDRMKKHIHTVVGRYKGRIHGWDVVNEAILDDGSWRKSKFYSIIGEDYIKLAFQFAHEADPNAELYYNDYSMFHKGKREGVLKMVQHLQEQDVRIDGIGMQAHYGLDSPDFKEFEESLITFSNLGVKVMVTELDITVLPFPEKNSGADISLDIAYNKALNPYANQLPDSITQLFNKRYTDFFKILNQHQDKISRVTFWGVHDGQSWKNNWPVKGRTDYPLLFDRAYQPKPIVKEIIENS